jgi:hypothetical protein
MRGSVPAPARSERFLGIEIESSYFHFRSPAECWNQVQLTCCWHTPGRLISVPGTESDLSARFHPEKRPETELFLLEISI